ncbi:hypothetical protein C8J57DRAFT_1239489 [Mycena rebaudengoi]|nr:hypothetical protein C8J57DRAFT_1239489 [Mycena rebaudengoi]
MAQAKNLASGLRNPRPGLAKATWFPGQATPGTTRRKDLPLVKINRTFTSIGPKLTESRIEEITGITLIDPGLGTVTLDTPYEREAWNMHIGHLDSTKNNLSVDTVEQMDVVSVPHYTTSSCALATQQAFTEFHKCSINN